MKVIYLTIFIAFVLNGCGGSSGNTPSYEMTEQKDGFWSIKRENNNTLYGFFYIEKFLFLNKDTNITYGGLVSNSSNNGTTTELRIELDRTTNNQVAIDTGFITATTNNEVINNAFLEIENSTEESIQFTYIGSEIINNLNNFDGIYKDGNNTLDITNGIINIVDSQDCNAISSHNIKNNYIVDFSQQNCTFDDNGKFLVKVMDNHTTIYIGKIFYYPNFGIEKIFRFIKQ